MEAIVAINQFNQIGTAANTLPWHIPEDLQNFKKITINKKIIMGRKTFESLNRPLGLPNRENWVLSTNDLKLDESITVVNSFKNVPDDAILIGGSTLFNKAFYGHKIDIWHVCQITQPISTAPSDGVFLDFNLNAMCTAPELFGFAATYSEMKKCDDVAYRFCTLFRL